MLVVVNNNQTKIYKKQSSTDDINLVKLCIKFLDEKEFLSFFCMN